jgi:type IV pilus assembly protein PilO
MKLIFSLLARIPYILWFALAGWLAWSDWTNWQTEVWAGLESEETSKKALLQNLKRESQRAEDFSRMKEKKLKELQEISERLDAARGRFPSTPSVAQLLKDLADVADRTGLEFSSFKPMSERRNEFIVTSPIEVKIRGTYIQVMSFLDTSANLKRAVVTENLKFESPPANSAPQGTAAPISESHTIQASATLVTYSIDPSVTSYSPPATASPSASASTARPTPGVNNAASGGKSQ